MDGSVAVLGFVCVVLTGLMVYQQWFLSSQIKALVERLMARSLHEYEQAKHPPPPRVVIKRDEPLEDFDRILG